MANNTSFLRNTTFQDTKNISVFPPGIMSMDSMEVQIGKAVALTIVSIVAVIGNILVICAVSSQSHMRTVTNYLIINMSVADLLYTIIAIPPTFLEIFDAAQWCFETYFRSIYFCKVVHFGQYLLAPVSVLTLAMIAADRFFAIVIPLRKILTKKVFRVLIVITWIIAAGLAAPTIYAYRLHPVYVCVEEWSPAFDNDTASWTYTIMLFIVAYCFPFLMLSIMYSVICAKLWLRKIPGEDPNCKKNMESRKKVVKMLITVVIFFVICWLPIQVATLLWHLKKVTISYTFDFICKFMMRSHAAVSPCIYAAFSQNYRQAFKKVLTCGRCRDTDVRREYSVSLSNTQHEALIRRSTINGRCSANQLAVQALRRSSSKGLCQANVISSDAMRKTKSFRC